MNLTRRSVSLLLVLTVLLTLFTPFATTVTATNESMEFLSAERKEKGIELQWRMESFSEGEDEFILKKNNEQSPLTKVEIIESMSKQDGSIQRTYQFVDEQVVEGESYTYTVKATDNSELQTQPITLTFEQQEKTLPTINMKLSNITDQSVKVTWTEIAEADAYQVVTDGKVVTQLQQAGSYELKELKGQTSYKISVRAISKGLILTEAVKDVTTAAVETPENNEVSNNEIEEKKTLSTTNIPGELVAIPDTKLKRAIIKALQLNRDELYESDLQGLKTLDASNLGIKDITGLEKATNLTNLQLAGNDIKKATALQALTKLEYLDLSYYQGNDIGFLSSLNNLKTLILADSPISSIEPISTLSHLEGLNISFTEIRDIAPLAKLRSLKELDVSYIDLTTLVPLKELNTLETLTIYGERYFDLLEEVKTLEREGLDILHDDGYYLYVTSVKANEEQAIITWEYEGDDDVNYYQVTVANQITRIDPDESAATLTIHSLEPNKEYTVKIEAYNQANKQVGENTAAFKTLPSPKHSEKVLFKDERLEKAIKANFGLDRDIVASDMQTLQELYLDNKRIKDLTGLEKASNLHSLSLSGNKITDLTPIATLEKVNFLIINDNPITNFEALKSMANVEVLALGATGIQDLSILANLQKLTDLSLDQNNLKSLETMPALVNLTSLSLYINNLETLKGIGKLPHLQFLDLDSNPLKSIAGIQQLSKLRDVYLSDTSLIAIDDLLTLAELQSIHLFENENLILTEKSEAREVINQLEQRGVNVNYEGAEEEWFEAFIEAVTEDSLHLHWEYAGEQEIAKYEVFVNDKKHITLEGDENFLEIDKLQPNTLYEVEVKAYNAEDEVIFASSVEETTWELPTGKKISFNDQNLKDLIKEQLNIERDPQKSDMEKLSSLYISESSIKDLSGLEYATNLYDFYLYNNAYPLDLTPLKELGKLYYLDISEAPIKDYSILKNFKQLNSLSIMNNNLTDLSFLSGLKKLQDITLTNNNITDLSALASLTRLYSINLANNKIADLSQLGDKENLSYLDVSGNPIEKLPNLELAENLYDLILDETKIEDLSPLLEVPNLAYVSLYNIATLNLSEGSTNTKIIEQLVEDGVRVNTEVDSSPELYVDEVTEDTVSVSWDPMLPKGVGMYNVNLYSVSGDELVKEVQVDSKETSYQFTGLSPSTQYYIAVNVEQEEYYGYAYSEVKTLPVKGSVKDVSLYVYKTKDVPEVNIMFDLHGMDEATENTQYVGESNEKGVLVNDSNEEPLDFFELPVGSYEVTFVTKKKEEVSFQFKVLGTENYLENPISFLIEENEQVPIIPPSDLEDKNEGDDAVIPEKTTPIKVNTPTKSINGNDEPKKITTQPVKGNNKQELPKTATVMYNFLLLGLIVLSLGVVVFIYTKRHRRNKSIV